MYMVECRFRRSSCEGGLSCGGATSSGEGDVSVVDFEGRAPRVFQAAREPAGAR